MNHLNQWLLLEEDDSDLTFSVPYPAHRFEGGLKSVEDLLPHRHGSAHWFYHQCQHAGPVCRQHI